ncbi:SIMPL domain-containing protein [Xanthobacter autotrophicus]|uniref:SIMPL domain-containing protein n=1 Tax=Xanthobacter autotrophicus TaxID=280 RepID=UPI00372C3C06
MRAGAALAVLVTCVAAISAAGAQSAARADASVPLANVEVRGSATVSLVPDMAIVSLAVVTRAEKAPAALDQNSAEAARLIAFCKASGIDGALIRSGPVRVTPRFRTVNDGRGAVQQDDGYEASNTIRVKLADLSKVGAFVRDAIDHGANRVNGVEFNIADRDKASESARAAAFADAQRKAQHLAGLADLKLDRVLRIIYPPRAAEAVGEVSFDLPMQPRLNVPLEAGTIDLHAEVDVTWGATWSAK